LSPASGAIEIGELIRDPPDVLHVLLGDRLDLPLHEVQVPDATSTARVALERSMLGMDVELDAPADGRHGEVDACRSSIRCAYEHGLILDRDSSRTQRLSEPDFVVRLVGCRAIESLEVASEQAATRARGVAETSLDTHELFDGDLPLVQQLVKYREMVKRAEIGREIESKPVRTGDDDSVSAHRAMARDECGGLPEVDTCRQVMVVVTVRDGEMQECRTWHAAKAGEHPCRWTGHESGRMSHTEDGTALLDRGWRRRDDEHPAMDWPEHACGAQPPDRRATHAAFT
jgi:hypothetical protein